MKPAIRAAIFWQEIDLIQQRHRLFFSDGQRKYIKLRKTNDGHSLVFRDGHDLPSQVIMEIELAFKLTDPADS